MTGGEGDSFLYPNAGSSNASPEGVSRRQLLAGSATAGAAVTAGCLGGGDTEGDDTETDPGDETEAEPGESTQQSTVFVFNTGDGTVSLLDPETDELLETRAADLSSSFPSNQYTPGLTDDPGDSLWLNVGRGVRAVDAGSLSETASVETGSGANWLEQTPSGDHVVVSAREPTHAQFRIDADPDSGSFGEVSGEIDRTPEGGSGDRNGPGPCDVTIHPDGEYAYVPDIFGDTLTVVRVDPFEIEAQVEVQPVGDGPARPWMGTVSPDGQTLLVEHDEGASGTESIWDVSDPAAPEETLRLTPEDGLGGRPLTSEIGPDSQTGYVFTPGSESVTVVDIPAGEVSGQIDLGGSAFVGTWNPERTKLYVPVQTNDAVAVIDHERGEIVETISVGPSPYGATAARVRPQSDSAAEMAVALRRLGLSSATTETTYCIGKCACGHQL